MGTVPPFRYLSVSDRSVCPEPIPDRIRRLCDLGVPAIQVRDKTLTDRFRYGWLRELPATDTTFLVNGRVDMALLQNLEGVHLPSNGLPPDVAREVGGPELLYGQSVHSPGEIQRAFELNVDYVLYGPVFETPSKPDIGPKEVVGLDGLERATDRFDDPIFGIGGITSDRIGPCIEAGAYGVAGIRSLFASRDPGTKWSKIQRNLP